MSEDFDTILDRCLADIAAGRETIESCLRRYPAQASQLAVLLKLSEQVQAVPSTPLPADKRRALETRLLKRAAELRSQPISRSAAPRPPLWRRGVVLATASFIIAILLLGTVVGASVASVPGDVLYPVKRATEQVRMALTLDRQQAELHLEFARQRLQELSVLQERGKVSEELLTEISSETTLVLDHALALPQDRQQTVLTSLTEFQDQQLKVLAAMASSAQGEEQVNVVNALADTTAKRQQAKDLLAGATPVDNPTQEPELTIPHETQPSHGQPTKKPTTADKPEQQATAKATKMPPATVQRPTPKVEHTPPGQVKSSTPPAPTEKATKEPKPTKESKPTKTPK